MTPICFSVARIVGQVPSPTPIGGCWRDSMRVIANAVLASPRITRRQHPGGDPAGGAPADDHDIFGPAAVQPGPALRTSGRRGPVTPLNRWFLRATSADTCEIDAI